MIQSASIINTISCIIVAVSVPAELISTSLSSTEARSVCSVTVKIKTKRTITTNQVSLVPLSHLGDHNSSRNLPFWQALAAHNIMSSGFTVKGHKKKLKNNL